MVQIATVHLTHQASEMLLPPGETTISAAFGAIVSLQMQETVHDLEVWLLSQVCSLLAHQMPQITVRTLAHHLTL
jgi:hypothetical protein